MEYKGANNHERTKIEIITKQIEKHQNHKFVEEYYDERLKNIKK